MMFQQATPDQPQGFIFDQPDSPEVGLIKDLCLFGELKWRPFV